MGNKVIGVAYGDPLDPNTFSGYSKNLFQYMIGMDRIQILVSSQNITFQDILSGALDVRPWLIFHKANNSINWLWKSATIIRLSRRIEDLLRSFSETIPVLQIGTHIVPVDTRRSYYCITDMTIIQAMEAGYFRVSKLRKKNIQHAIDAQKMIFNEHKKIFVLCEWTKSSVVNDYQQQPEKVVVIGAGANIGSLTPSNNKYTSRKILFVGYDWIRKGGPLLLESFRILRRWVPSAELHIVGCKVDIDDEGVVVWGKLRKDNAEERDKLFQLWQEANCFCLLPEFDPFPNVIIEAMANRTPVVALNTGSRREIVIDGHNGYLVPRDPLEVAQRILPLLTDRELSAKMGQNGYQYISDHYTWDIVTKRIMAEISKE